MSAVYHNFRADYVSDRESPLQPIHGSPYKPCHSILDRESLVHCIQAGGNAVSELYFAVHLHSGISKEACIVMHVDCPEDVHALSGGEPNLDEAGGEGR